MYFLKGENDNYGINLPTELKEITPEILSGLVNNISLPNHYVIVAMIAKANLYSVALNIKNGEMKVNGAGVFLAKINEEDNNKLQAVIGDKLIIPQSVVQMGSHVPVKTVLTIEQLSRFFENNKGVVKDILSKKHNISNNVTKSDNIYLLSFKIVELNAIRGVVKKDIKVQDPFMVKNEVVN